MFFSFYDAVLNEKKYSHKDGNAFKKTNTVFGPVDHSMLWEE